MNVGGVDQAGQAGFDLKDKRASEGDEKMFASMLTAEQTSMPPRPKQGEEGQGADGGFEAVPFEGEPIVSYVPGYEPMDDAGETSPDRPERQEAAELREQADDLRNQADDIAGADGATQADADMAQVLRSRAVALDQRADAVEERADIADERDRIAERSETLNGGGVDSPDPVVDGTPTPRPVDVPPEVGFGSEADIERFEAALTAIPGFSEIDVNATREATAGEVDLLLDLAETQGASAEDLELIEGFAQAFPIQFVFVDGLESEAGFEAAAGGELAVENTSTILLDSEFIDDDFTLEGSFEGEDLTGAASEAVEFAFASILEIFDLPGENAAKPEALTSVLPPIVLNGAAEATTSTEEQPEISGLAASEVVGGTEDLDGEE